MTNKQDNIMILPILLIQLHAPNNEGHTVLSVILRNGLNININDWRNLMTSVNCP